jgi:predicted DsbA family dithiol-disulfide isomerase
LEKLTQSHGVEVVWHSYELRPKGSPPMPPEYLARIKAGRPRLLQIAREYYGLEINQGPHGISSRDALIGAKYAEAQGKGPQYHAVTLRAYWQRANDISERVILGMIAQSIGLDEAAFRAALDDPHYDEQVEADVVLAYQYGLTGVPALIFNNKYLVSGAQPYEVLKQVVERVQSEEASEGNK